LETGFLADGYRRLDAAGSALLMRAAQGRVALAVIEKIIFSQPEWRLPCKANFALQCQSTRPECVIFSCGFEVRK